MVRSCLALSMLGLLGCASSAASEPVETPSHRAFRMLSAFGSASREASPSPPPQADGSVEPDPTAQVRDDADAIPITVSAGP